MPDFDPFKIPAYVTEHMLAADEPEKARVAAEFAKRAVAAKYLLSAAAECRQAKAKLADPADERIDKLVAEIVRLAGNIHDYVPDED